MNVSLCFAHAAYSPWKPSYGNGGVFINIQHSAKDGSAVVMSHEGFLYLWFHLCLSVFWFDMGGDTLEEGDITNFRVSQLESKCELCTLFAYCLMPSLCNSNLAGDWWKLNYFFNQSSKNIIFLYYFWHSDINPVGFIVTTLIPCFLCLMKNSPGLSRGSPSYSPAQDPPSSPWAPVKSHFSLASNKQLQVLILSHGVEATFHPSHLWFPKHFQKSPRQFSDLSQLLACPRARATLLCAPAASFAMVMGPHWRAPLSIHGVHCVRGQMRESPHRGLAGNECGVAVRVIVWGLSLNK